MEKFLNDIEEVWIDNNFSVGDFCKIKNYKKGYPVKVSIYHHSDYEWSSFNLHSDELCCRSWIVEDIGILNSKLYLKFKGFNDLFLADDFYLVNK